MENEEIGKIIQQLGEIGTLIEKFSETASEMKKSMDAATVGLKSEKANLENAIRNITSNTGRWESKLTSTEKDVNDTNSKILALTSSVTAVNKLIEERVAPIKDFSVVCSSMLEKLDALGGTIDVLSQRVDEKTSESETIARLDKLEREIDALSKNQEQITSLLLALVENADNRSENHTDTDESETT